MPIKGMTDQAPSFPQIGVIRKGAPKPKDGKRPGKDLQYFRVEFDEEEVEAAEVFARIYGNTPTEINILIPFDEIDRSWEAWREAYVASALIHRCDGENVVYAIDPKTGEVLVQNGVSVKTHQPVACDGKAKCKPTGRLRVIIPELQRLAYMLVLTTSIHDICNISKQLKGIKDMNGDRLRGIPLVLRRRPKKISTPSGPNGKRARRVKWLLSIEADPKWVKAKMEQIQAASYPRLTAPEDWDDDLDFDEPVDAEFTSADDIDEAEAEIDIPLNGNEDEENEEELDNGGGKQHWTKTQNWATFWTYWKNERCLTEADIHAAAGVDSMKKFTGSKKELQAKVEAYIAAQIDAGNEEAEAEHYASQALHEQEERVAEAAKSPEQHLEDISL